MKKEDQAQEPKITITDRRRVSSEKDVKSSADYQRKYPSYVEQLQRQLSDKDERLKSRLEELDKENKAFKKRMESEMERRLESSMMNLFNSLLDVADNFERALESAKAEHSFDELMKGMNMIRDNFLDVLKKSEVTPLDILDTPFAPDLAEAMGIVEVSDPSENNIVKEELLKGYKYKEKLLRPAKVRVGQCKKKA